MITNKFKQRANTLSKTLLTAGLLGGTALSTLGAGSAQAATGWVGYPPNGYKCMVGSTPGTGICDFTGADPTPTTVPIPIPDTLTNYPNDKILTLLGQTGLLINDTISFTKQASSWEFDLDFSLDRIAGDSGNLDYKIKITDPAYQFEYAGLSSMLSQMPAIPVGAFEVTKSIYSDAGFTSLLLKLTNNELPPVAGTLVTSGLINSPIDTIYVRDEWTIPIGSNTKIDAIQNNYTQAEKVPAPLPLLGVAAAFGSIRKLRKFSSQLKTFSMG